MVCHYGHVNGKFHIALHTHRPVQTSIVLFFFVQCNVTPRIIYFSDIMDTQRQVVVSMLESVGYYKEFH